jgi:beta-glucosidase
VVTFTVAPRQLAQVNADGRRVLAPGAFAVSVGGKQPGFTGVADNPTTGVLTGRFEVTGAAIEVRR